MSDIRLHQLSKIYGTRAAPIPALSDLSLHVNDGEFMVLVGPSGCGKSTALRLIAGLESPSRGSVSMAGRDMARVAPRDRDIAMVFQHFALYPHLNVFDNLAFGLRTRRMARAEIRASIQDCAALLGITQLLERLPETLSGGEQQRVALGRAIVRRPRAFLMDEPLASLDPRLRLSTRSEIKSLHRRLGTTILYVTHDQEEAMVLGDRMAVLSGGKLQQVGAPKDVYDRPANRFVGAFVGAPPMSFLQGRIEPGPGGSVFVRSLDALKLPARVTHVGEVILGIRARDIVVQPGTAVGTAGMPRDAGILSHCVVDHVETYGDRTDVHLVTPSGEQLIGRLPPGLHTRAGESATVRLDPRAAHWFEPGSYGRRLE